MPSRHSFFSSSVGSKYVIALSGLALVGFLIGHLAGNLLIYISPQAFNAYGENMIHNPLLIPAELGLLAIFLLHAYKAARLFLGSQTARPVGYARTRWAGHTSRKSWASATMILSGTFLLVFVPLHLKTFKYGPHYDAADGGRDLWRLLVEVFSRPGYVAFYSLGMVIVGFHLWHGVSSAFQSVGADRGSLAARIRLAGWVLAVLIGGGFLSIPLYVYFLRARP
jgi:succinate dehydrogenase / fumarate reductase cytochrome b subunit